MKKGLRFSILAAAMSCLVSMNAMAIDIVDGVYQITNASDFAEYGSLVAAGNDTIKGALTTDIDFQDVAWEPVGTELVPFKGIFDGQGHRIKNLVINSTETHQGLFGYIGDGCVIKNVIIDSSCSITGGDYTAGIAGGSVGSGTAYFTNVGNEANITGGINTAGIIGVSMSTACTFIVLNAYNTGNVTGTGESAALSGWMGPNSKVTHFFNTGAVEGVDGDKKLFRNPPSTKNVYDIEGIQGDSISEEMLANGMLTYYLNENRSDSIAWYQNLDAGTPDAIPVLDSTHSVVYPVGALHCDGTLYEDATFSNTNQTVQDAHDYVDGVCSYCEAVDFNYITKNDSVYEISDAKQLNWLAAYVNSLDGTKKVYVRIMNDIDFSEYTQMGVLIGKGGHDFNGWFDGQGHKITISYDTEEQYVSLFRYNKGTIRNLITEGDIVTTRKHASGIAAYLVGGNSCVENCISTVSVISELEGDATYAGIAAISSGGKVRNCAFFGEINDVTSYGNGGIVGWGENGAVIENCYVNATFNVQDGDNNIIVRNSPTIKNCYYVDAANLNLPTSGAKQITEEQIGSGELAYYLNSLRSDTVSWYQNIDNGGEVDAYPVPFNTHGVVYAVGTLHCDGTPAGGEGYSNTNNSVTEPHDYQDGICSFCADVKKDYMTPVDEYYEISTPEQLNWFAHYTSKINGKVNAKLTSDIDFTKYSADSVMIGSTKDFGGIFDGQNHIVTVAYDRKDTLGRASLFCVVDGGTVKNLRVDGTISTGYLIGGIVGTARNNALIENCLSTVTLKSFRIGDATIGGVAANGEGHVVFRNCGFVGSIISENGSGNGGLIGYANGGAAVVLENCFVAGETFVVPDDNNSAMLCRNNPSILNCYYVDPGTLVLDTRATEVGVDQVASGELCFLLNQKQNGGKPWTQTIGTDKYPTPFSGDNVVYAIGDLNCDGAVLDLTFSNTEGELNKPEHAYDADGICGTCGGRLISTGAQLLALSNDINSGFANNDINVILANDIDMDGIDGYLGIGTDALPYIGKFDGQNHVIRNLIIDTTEPKQGLFSYVGAGAEIKNVTMDASCSITVNGAGYAGGIIAATKNDGMIIIENCGNEASVTADGPNAAGIVGVNYNGGTLLRIKNCYNAGTIIGKNESAGISGWLSSASELTNCYNIGLVRGIDGTNTFTRSSSAPVYKNCYETIGSQVQKVTVDFVQDGGLCYALNDSVSGGENFFQTLGTDLHPVLFKDHQKVYEVNGKYVNDVVGIKDIIDNKKTNGAVRVYSVDGMRLQGLQKGINIIRKADGTTEKVLVK